MNDGLHHISACEVCGNQRLSPALDLGGHPMCDDLVAIGDPRTCREYPIEILFCEVCLTAHQRYQVAKHELFPMTYHYRSRFTADVLKGMDNLVASCVAKRGSLTGATVLDIGCNDGSLLDFFNARGARTVGIEPTEAALDARAKSHSVYQGFLSPSLARQVVVEQGRPDVITFTNVFAHIENLREVLDSLRALMAPTTTIVIENHYLGSVLDGNQFDTFYHEHPRTYSYSSFEHIARSLGVPLDSVEFPSRYGGNIRVFLGNGLAKRKDGVDMDALAIREKTFKSRFAEMQANIATWRHRKSAEIAALVAQHGPLRAKAFPGRAAILVKLLGLDTTSVERVHEKPGSLKIGHYLPGTRIPIGSDDELFALPDQTKPILNLAWHIPREIREYLTTHGYRGQVIDVLRSEDFAEGR